MPIYIDEPSNNGDDSVLITDLRKCRAIEDIDKYIDKITRKPTLMDKFKSCLSKKEVKKYKVEITKEKVRSATLSSTFDLARTGSEQMKQDDYEIANGDTTLEI